MIRLRRSGVAWHLLLFALMNLFVLLGRAPVAAAYMSSTGAAGAQLAAGTFASLMTVSPAATAINLSGRTGDSFSAAVTVTSRARVTLPIAAVWQGDPLPGATLGISSGSIAPGQSVTVTVAGAFSGSGSTLLKVVIGQEYDWTLIPVTETALTWAIGDLIRIEPADAIFYASGADAPQFTDLTVGSVYATAGRPPIRYSVSQDPADASPVAVISPAGVFEPDATGTAIRIAQNGAGNGGPTHVTITFAGNAPYITGTASLTFTLAPPPDPPPAPDPGAAAVPAPSPVPGLCHTTAGPDGGATCSRR